MTQKFCIVLFLLIVLSVFLLSGCSSTHPVEVKVPVASFTGPIQIPAKPKLPIYSLTSSSAPDEVLKAYVASIYELQQYNDMLIELIKDSQ